MRESAAVCIVSLFADNERNIGGVVDRKLAAVIEVNRRNVIINGSARKIFHSDLRQIDNVAAVGSADSIVAVAVGVEEEVLPCAADKESKRNPAIDV